MARQLTKKQTRVQKIVKKIPTQVAVNSSSNTAMAANTVKLPVGEYVTAVGRRKVSTARVRVYLQKGDYLVNGVPAGQYFAAVPHASMIYMQPLVLLDLKGKVMVSAKVTGSGIKAQLTAVVHALAKALVKQNADFKPVLKDAGFLTRDDRMKETRKIGHGGKARRKRQSPKR